MTAIPRRALSLLLAAMLVGCGTGVPYTSMEPQQSAFDPEMGRIFLYRTTVFGAAIQPRIILNGDVVGISKAKGFFFVDRPPGEYVIQTSTEVERRLSFVLEPGETR